MFDLGVGWVTSDWRPESVEKEGRLSPSSSVDPVTLPCVRASGFPTPGPNCGDDKVA